MAGSSEYCCCPTYACPHATPSFETIVVNLPVAESHLEVRRGGEVYQQAWGPVQASWLARPNRESCATAGGTYWSSGYVSCRYV
jgi:hypothetical protein